MNDDRDLELGAALATLDVPEHRPGFWDELERRLAPDRIQRAESSAPIVSIEAPPHRRPRGPLLLVAAIVVVLGVAAAIFASRESGNDVTTTPDVHKLPRTVSGLAEVTTYTDAQPSVRRYKFWRDSSGSYRISGVDHEEERAYNAATGVHTWHFVDPEGNVLNARDTGVPLGRPDHGLPLVLDLEFSTALQTARSAPNPDIRDDEVDGRSAWLVVVPLAADALGGPGGSQYMDVYIDKETSVPLRINKFAAPTGDGHVYETTRFSELVVNDPIPPGFFQVDIPASARSTDYGFTRVATPDEASAATGYPAPEPNVVPEGYTLASVAWAKEAAPTGAEAANPQSLDVITLLYTRGFEWFTVSTRRSLGGQWDDPIAGEGLKQDYQTVMIGTTPAQLSITQPFPPHLWAITGDLVLTVAGNLTADELRRVAESIG